MVGKMTKIQLTNKKKVFNYCKPYVIAEFGSNHNGDMNLAKKLISLQKNWVQIVLSFKVGQRILYFLNPI